MHLERRHDTSRSFDEGRPPWLTTTAETEMGEGSAGDSPAVLKVPSQG